MKRKELRSGYTTGACAAAAAKAATRMLLRTEASLSSEFQISRADEVDIPFPDGDRATFGVHRSGYGADEHTAFASIIKDAGDDPDVTNGAEVVAEAKVVARHKSSDNSAHLVIKGGRGVGIVTKPGLAISVGEPAINSVPRKMIADAVSEALSEIVFQASALSGLSSSEDIVVEVTISVTNGELLAKKTLNERLGIIGGLSILGTTGIVRPLSSEAWTATISSSMDVARAMGRDEIVLSAGRASEKAHMKRYNLSDESYVMMGDYLEFSLREAARRGFSRINLCAQWAKMLKIAMATPQTHVRHGAIDMEKTIAFLTGLGQTFQKNTWFNTAREIFDYMQENSAAPQEELIRVCNAAESYAAGIANPVSLTVHLVSYDGEIIAQSA
jgi:cobalt-precorrin-5B (C1)-methyltransferase